MGIKEAIDLISFTTSNDKAQHWADFGCGEGVFTKALANLLPVGSVIHAIDLDERAVKKIPGRYEAVSIEKFVLDFTSDEIPFQRLDGILMANSLHYVKDQESFVKRMIGWLKGGGCFLLVDYDFNRANHWVPYPLPLAFAGKMLLNCGFKSFTILNKRKSVFGDRWIYAALAKK